MSVKPCCASAMAVAYPAGPPPTTSTPARARVARGTVAQRGAVAADSASQQRGGHGNNAFTFGRALAHVKHNATKVARLGSSMHGEQAEHTAL